MVEGVLGSEDLLIVNPPNSPATVVNELGFRSWIDVTAVLHYLVAKVEGWRVHADLEIGSDNRFITFQIQAKFSGGVIRQCPNCSKVKWAHFHAELMARLHGYSELTEVPDSISAVDDFERCLTSNIQTVIDHQVPMKRICDFSRSWWTPEIKNLRKRQN